MKKLTITLVVVFSTLILVGCGKKTVEVTDVPADLSVGSELSTETQGASLE